MILLASILLRVVALIWSVVLLRRIKDWRMGFLTAMLALMALRQGLTLRKAIVHDHWSPFFRGAAVDELPGLAVSVLAGLAVVFLERILRDQRLAHEELRARDSRALQAQKMEALGHLAGRTAHDFNNLLAVIIGNAELARSSLPEGHPALENLTELEKASERAADLSGQILSFSRKQVVDESVFDVNDVVRELDLMLRQLLGSEVEYVTLFRATRAIVKADRSQLGQVLMNLAVNARDAMPDGGTFTITTEVDARGGEPSIVVTVRDTGHGMTPEQKERAFEPFYTTKPVGKGTGLGLSTCLGIVERNGGEITIKSSTAAGTEFRLVFPQAAEADPAPPLTHDGSPASMDSTDAPSSKGSECVLIAEDEEPLRKLEASALRARGYEVIEASTGAEALRAAEALENPLALLVTDVVMPLMDGPELASHLRARTPGLAVLFTSGYVQSPDSEGLTDDGVSGFLQKPFGGEEFATSVRSVLDRRAARLRGGSAE